MNCKLSVKWLRRVKVFKRLPCPHRTGGTYERCLWQRGYSTGAVSKVFTAGTSCTQSKYHRKTLSKLKNISSHLTWNYDRIANESISVANDSRQRLYLPEVPTVGAEGTAPKGGTPYSTVRHSNNEKTNIPSITGYPKATLEGSSEISTLSEVTHRCNTSQSIMDYFDIKSSRSTNALLIPKPTLEWTNIDRESHKYLPEVPSTPQKEHPISTIQQGKSPMDEEVDKQASIHTGELSFLKTGVWTVGILH